MEALSERSILFKFNWQMESSKWGEETSKKNSSRRPGLRWGWRATITLLRETFFRKHEPNRAKRELIQGDGSLQAFTNLE